ncbi:MAG: glycosyltransferase [Acidobacteriota bacterium]|nr:glycosyltransferase [Acidobacteriota bacterium]
MRILIFCHSILSDWNHGNAHFLRGITTELMRRGHAVRIFEPQNAWSLQNLFADRGEAPIAAFRVAYPGIDVTRYVAATLDLASELDNADIVIVHEWNEHDLVRRIGEHHARGGAYTLLFHDTHHRAVTDRASVARYDLRHYDGVLAFGNVIRDLYLSRGWAKQAWTWHEAADTNVFYPRENHGYEGDLVWIGNWGDDERTGELQEFVLGPVKALRLKARVYGVRYPDSARGALSDAEIEYCGWLPNFQAPDVFAKFRVTIHVPRRPYATALPGIPTIRVFEALACAIPLVSAPWDDAEGLFTPGEDFLIARDGEDMKRRLSDLLANPERASRIANHGLETIRSRHTCAHRVDELMGICALEN